MNPHPHTTDDQLEAYALRQLAISDQSEMDALEEHLIVCSNCRDRLDGVEAFTSGMNGAFRANSAITVSKQTRVSSWLQWPRISYALSLLTLILIISLFSSKQPRLAPAAYLQLTAIRGEMPSTPPARELDLTLLDPPAGGHVSHAIIVNSAGRPVWNGIAQRTAAGLEVKEQPRLKRGYYFLRLYGASGEVVREYGFRIL